jgi:hypothetical protein
VAERLNAPVSKTGMGGFVHRGFESLPLRSLQRKARSYGPCVFYRVLSKQFWSPLKTAKRGCGRGSFFPFFPHSSRSALRARSYASAKQASSRMAASPSDPGKMCP